MEVCRRCAGAGSRAQGVGEFERLCFDMYESGDAARAAEAGRVLAGMAEDSAAVSQCRAVLQASQACPYLKIMLRM